VYQVGTNKGIERSCVWRILSYFIHVLSKDSILLIYDSVSMGNQILPFRRNVMWHFDTWRRGHHIALEYGKLITD